MQFLAPALLWTLVALLPLAAIYFLKVRPRRKPVTAFFLWQKVFTEKKSSALFKRLRDVLSLIILLLAFAAIALALAEPDFAGDERKDLIIIVDQSASMATRESGSTRLELAKAKARDLIHGMNTSQRAAIATVSQSGIMRAHLTRHRKTLLEAVDAIEATALPSRAEALLSLQSSDAGLKQARAFLITDGCLELPGKAPTVEVIRVPATAGNVGIVHADLRAIPGGVGRLGLFLKLVSTHAAPVRLDVALRHEDTDRIMKLIPVTLHPGENPPMLTVLEDAPAGRWSATVEQADALNLDDRASFSVPPRQPVLVGILAEDTFFLQHVIAAFERSDQTLALAQDAAQAQFMLARHQVPQQGDAIVFQPQGESAFWQGVAGDELTGVIPRVLIRDHPLLRYLDAETINYAGARQLTAPPGALVLVQGEEGVPLMYLLREGGRTVCVVNLDPVEAQFYLSAWFPVLVHQAAAFVTERLVEPPATITVGQQAPVPGLGAGMAARLRTPSGIELDFTGPQTPQLSDVGFYQVSHPQGSLWLGCSLISPAESSLPSENIALQPTQRPVAAGQSPSYWLLVVAVAMLAGESFLYHRRKVG